MTVTVVGVGVSTACGSVDDPAQPKPTRHNAAPSQVDGEVARGRESVDIPKPIGQRARDLNHNFS
ncbi:MAG: hypothetical protein CVU56_27810 [Deltaproteobacteria bacterium HGW-Deltaproteobacteria-14]|nr:MAG: hypothetical protein CVU56_27810 [Deltaproteobacteria bacterium HGW-Deltaproteobacteria-14]